MRTCSRLLHFLASILFLAACQPAPQNQLTIFAAASLTEAFEELGAAFEHVQPDADLRFNFAGSTTLAVQILEGAPADIFAAADLAQMQSLEQAQLLHSDPQDFASNHLILIFPADNPAQITTFSQLAQPGLRLLLAAPGVPIREYSDQLIAQLGNANFQANVYANLVSEEESVRAVLSKIALGEADAGLVYASDINSAASDKILSIQMPTNIEVLIRYPIAALSSSSNPSLAAEFIAFTISAPGQAILAAWGFESAR
jgi:molybdate transport system substrate-binding protein